MAGGSETVTASTPDERTVVLEARVPFGRAAAYRAFTDVDVLARWFWPESMRPAYELDLGVGGRWRVASELVGMAFTATYSDLEPDARLAMEWRWDGDPEVTTVEVRFEDAGDGAIVRVTHGENPSESAREEHRVGWTDCLSRLTALSEDAG